jgi:hypothetical protein
LLFLFFSSLLFCAVLFCCFSLLLLSLPHFPFLRLPQVAVVCTGRPRTASLRSALSLIFSTAQPMRPSMGPTLLPVRNPRFLSSLVSSLVSVYSFSVLFRIRPLHFSARSSSFQFPPTSTAL